MHAEPFVPNLARGQFGKRGKVTAVPRSRIVIESLEPQEERLAGLAAGLLAPQAHISPKFLYDAQGCALYQAICNLQEYYPTRTEQGIFAAHRASIAHHLPRGGQWIDLGCGDGAKSWPWLQAVNAARYVGVDIAQDWLENTLNEGHRQYPNIDFVGIVTDFTRPLRLRTVLHANEELPPVFFYPGSSIGNFAPDEALRLLSAIRGHLGSTGRLLIGADAPKPASVLHAAYDDALGVTAAFNRNVLRVASRELGCHLPPELFSHQAWYNEDAGRIEMHLVARAAHSVQIGTQFRHFEPGEIIVTEHSYKYAPERFRTLLAEAGFGNVERWSDERGWFNVFVASLA